MMEISKAEGKDSVERKKGSCQGDRGALAGARPGRVRVRLRGRSTGAERTTMAAETWASLPAHATL